jgi:type I restriction enzyme M protein
MSRLEAVTDKAMLFDIFRRAENYLWEANIESGLPRFFEFAPFLFLKLMDERWQEPLWKSLKGQGNKISYLNEVIIPTLRERYNAHDVFAETKMTKEAVAKKITALLDNFRFACFESDILGDAFEYFLKNNTVSKQNLGQYFTPRHIAKIMVGLVSPTNKDSIYDPFCGTGGLLTEAFNHTQELGLPKGALFFGKDVSVSARAAKMNAILHWGDQSGIEQVSNTLGHPVHEKYTVGLTNVPFARDLKNYPYNGLYQNGIAKKKTDVLSILHLFQAIRKGGRMAVIVPEGFLLGKERADARKFLTDNADLRLVASMPHGIFLPYTHVKTAIIYLENIHCPTRQKHFWYFDVENDGWTFDKHRKKIEGRNSLDAIKNINLNGTPEEELISLGYVKVPFEKIRQKDENWIGKHYPDANTTVSSPHSLVPLGELVTFVSTGFSGNLRHLSNDGIPFFTLKSIKKDFFLNCETKFLKYETQTSEKNICLKGDILVAMKDKNREVAILGKATIASENGIFSADLAKIEIRAENLLLREYLYYFFKNETYIKEIKKFSAGSIVKSISLENMASIKIPLPSLSTQRQAVEEFKRYEKMILSQNETARFVHEKCQERLKSLWG